MMVTCQNRTFDLRGDAAACAFVLASTQFNTWLGRMDERFVITAIEVQSVDKRFDGGLLFAKLRAEVTDPEGNRIPGSVFLRGDAVAVFIVLHDGTRDWVVLTTQPRFPVGVFESVEIPAGMMDDRGSFAGTAAREVQEETGLVINHERLTLLDEFAPSGGGSDEFIKLYSYEAAMPPGEIAALQGRLAGAHHEHERMSVLLVPLDELPQHTKDIKALLAYGCYHRWRMEGRRSR
ncbi:NUDIX domain-containing protein [bacterium]|nr:NUDIX domain-containing protein [bacterium]